MEENGERVVFFLCLVFTRGAFLFDGVTPSWYVRLGHTCGCEQGY